MAVTLGVTANGLTSLIAESAQKIQELVAGKKSIEKQQLGKTALQPILREAIENISEHLFELTSKRAEVLCSF